MTWKVFGARATYVVYLDDVAKKRTTSRIGSVQAACRLVRRGVAGERIQIVKELPVRSFNDRVIFTWVKRKGLWRIEPAFAFGPPEEYTDDEENAA